MIWAITTVCGPDEDGMLGHWLRHYGELADEMVACVTSGSYIRPEPPSPIVAAITERQAIGDQQHMVHADILMNLGVRDHDWVITADLDEFYEFRGLTARQVCDLLEREEADGIMGHFVDMVAKDGSLPAASIATQIHQQYPVETRLTELLLRGGTRKVMLHRPWVNLSPGHHGASIHQHMNHPHPKLIDGLGDYKVRHYKWRHGLPQRLRFQANSGHASDRWVSEAMTMLAYLARNDGKINFNDPPGLTDMANRRFDNPC